MHRLARGFEMEVFDFDPYIKKEDIAAGGAKPVDSYQELFAFNFVSLHIPATPETKNSINKDLLCAMPKNGVLVNTARAEVVDEAGLLAAFGERRMIFLIACVHVDRTSGGDLLRNFGGLGTICCDVAFIVPCSCRVDADARMGCLRDWQLRGGTPASSGLLLMVLIS